MSTDGTPHLKISAWAIRNPTPVALLFIALVIVGMRLFFQITIGGVRTGTVLFTLPSVARIMRTGTDTARAPTPSGSTRRTIFSDA